ncbi:MAG: hypothetical protein NG740_02860 [Omnitrophica bacterium]|nr:hypothetical protein [Candidatus Omnitrophota bacterium]
MKKKKTGRKKMAQSKEDRQKELNRLLDQAKDGFRKFGKELGVLAKKSEKGLAKVSKSGKIQLDIMGLNVQKEKLFYDIGKKVADLNTKKDLGLAELESYWRKMDKIHKEVESKRKALSSVKGEE